MNVAMAGGTPDMVPVSPGISEGVPVRHSGLDYIEFFLKEKVPMWKARIETAGQLATLVERAIPRKAWPPDIHPATRVFQSLRIFVNDEFEEIEAGIPHAIESLRPGGRIVAIAFHSGEDRLVKNILRDAGGGGQGDPITGHRPKARLKILTKKPVVATEEEVQRNPGARSAKLRAAEKLEV